MLHFNFKKTALLTISLLMHPAYTLTTTVSYAPAKESIIKINDAVDQIFLKNSLTYKKSIALLKTSLQEFITALKDISLQDNSKYTKKLCELGMQVKIKLENVIIVLENNINTNPLLAFKVGLEIQKVCNITELFKDITKQLDALLEEAKAERNIPMAKELHSLRQTLSKIDQMWQDENHNDKALEAGLRHRMKQK